MAKKFTINSVIKSIAEDGNKLKIVGYASTSDTDRSGDVILPDAWTKGGLTNYLNNPIILFNHDRSKPIGRAISVEVDSQGLRIECEISSSAGEAHGLIKDGVLCTFSVGFMIKDADYNQATDGYIIREAELLEVSVVSIPCNQAAVFSVKKSLDSANEIAEFNIEVNALKGQNTNNEEVNASNSNSDSPKPGTKIVPSEKKKMEEEELKLLIAKATADALAKQKAEDAEVTRAKEAKKAEEARIVEVSVKAAEAASKSTEERLLAEFDTKLKANNENFEKTFNEMKTDFESKAAEFKSMSESKRQFSDRGNGGDILSNKENLEQATDAYMLSRVLRKSITDTKFGKELMEKFNQHSTVNVGTDRLETTVSTNIERDIWNELILAPLFREINMSSAQMTFPIMPDAGYAEITTATTAGGTQPNGNVDPRGAAYGTPYSGIGLTEKTLSTVKMISKGYLGNETEEDAILPIMPLIRESMIRSHARGVENLILAGNFAQGTYTAGAANGLLKFASTNGRNATTASLATPVSGAGLFGLRKIMGKYGMNPKDIVYIVSQDAYYELIEDPEFLDADLVGIQDAHKLTGTVGRLYGSQVLVCDEFAPKAAGNYMAIALNRKNFVVPRLRGVTVESEYQTEEQRTVLVTSQRLGFDEIIPNAPSVVGLKYGA
jgi:HK97 family phage prohead protease